MQAEPVVSGSQLRAVSQTFLDPQNFTNFDTESSTYEHTNYTLKVALTGVGLDTNPLVAAMDGVVYILHLGTGTEYKIPFWKDPTADNNATSTNWTLGVNSTASFSSGVFQIVLDKSMPNAITSASNGTLFKVMIPPGLVQDAKGNPWEGISDWYVSKATSTGIYVSDVKPPFYGFVNENLGVADRSANEYSLTFGIDVQTDSSKNISIVSAANTSIVWDKFSCNSSLGFYSNDSFVSLSSRTVTFNLTEAYFNLTGSQYGFRITWDDGCFCSTTDTSDCLSSNEIPFVFNWLANTTINTKPAETEVTPNRTSTLPPLTLNETMSTSSTYFTNTSGGVFYNNGSAWVETSRDDNTTDRDVYYRFQFVTDASSLTARPSFISLREFTSPFKVVESIFSTDTSRVTIANGTVSLYFNNSKIVDTGRSLYIQLPSGAFVDSTSGIPFAGYNAGDWYVIESVTSYAVTASVLVNTTGSSYTATATAYNISGAEGLTAEVTFPEGTFSTPVTVAIEVQEYSSPPALSSEVEGETTILGLRHDFKVNGQDYNFGSTVVTMCLPYKCNEPVVTQDGFSMVFMKEATSATGGTTIAPVTCSGVFAYGYPSTQNRCKWCCDVSSFSAYAPAAFKQTIVTTVASVGSTSTVTDGSGNPIFFSGASTMTPLVSMVVATLFAALAILL